MRIIMMMINGILAWCISWPSSGNVGMSFIWQDIRLLRIDLLFIKRGWGWGWQVGVVCVNTFRSEASQWTEASIVRNMAYIINSLKDAKPFSEPMLLHFRLDHYEHRLQSRKNSVEWRHFNPCRDEFILGDIKIYSQFLSFVAIGVVRIVEVLPYWMQKSLYSEKPIPQLLMTCRYRDPSHQLPWCWHKYSGFSTRRVKYIVAPLLRGQFSRKYSQ